MKKALSRKVGYTVQHRYGKTWINWAEYTSSKVACRVRDHFKGIKRLKTYYLGPTAPFNDVRVIEEINLVSIL